MVFCPFCFVLFNLWLILVSSLSAFTFKIGIFGLENTLSLLIFLSYSVTFGIFKFGFKTIRFLIHTQISVTLLGATDISQACMNTWLKFTFLP